MKYTINVGEWNTCLFKAPTVTYPIKIRHMRRRTGLNKVAEMTNNMH
jgi:hypothetical protein